LTENPQRQEKVLSYHQLDLRFAETAPDDPTTGASTSGLKRLDGRGAFVGMFVGPELRFRSRWSSGLDWRPTPGNQRLAEFSGV
jgi:hypothetical protein